MASPDDMVIRILTSDDVALMQELNTVFGEVFFEKATYTGKPPGTAYLRELLDSAYFIAVAALKNGRIIGGLAGYELKKFERERSEIYIYDLAVCEDHRRRGVATALIEALKEIANERGAYVIFVQADRSDGPAIALYEKLGIREEVLHFDIAVTKGWGGAV